MSTERRERMESFISSRIYLTTKNLAGKRRARLRKDFLNTRNGAENFSREVLAECETPEELDAQERFYIKKLDCKHPKGYNLTDGGRRSRQAKTKVEKQLDPRKEFFLKKIGAKITYYRTLRDISQKELAKRANMSVSSLSKIERGRYNDNVSVSLLFDIADGLQIDITMLVTFSDMEKSMWWKPLPKD